jgi:D-alanyl-D-alanine carboxypeptidase
MSPTPTRLRGGAGIVVACCLALAAIPPATASAGAAQADARLERALDRIVAAPDGPPGVSAVVQRRKELRLHTAGHAKSDSPRAIRLDDHMRIASVTKAFTGAVTLRLVERGKLALPATIGEIRPDLPASWHPITVRQLLYHTSGLPNYTATTAFQTYFPDHLGDFISVAQIIGFAASEPVEFAPGTRYEYSNTGTIVLGLMAETATRKPFAELLKQLVLKPLGLDETSFPSGVALALPKPFVRGYVFDGPGLPPVNVSQLISPSGTWSAGAIVSTPRDLNTFVRAWAGGGLLSKPAVRKAQTAFLPPFSGGEPPGPGLNRGGLTLYRYRTPCGVVFGHTGNFPGYTQFIAASPDGRNSAVVSANLQLNAPNTGPQDVFRQLRHIFRRAACAALAG